MPAPGPGPREGDVLAGRYRIQRILGAGGMGVVVAAQQIEIGRSVAVKLMQPHLAQNRDAAARFLREARASAALEGDHVARVYDVGRLDDGAPYMAMELLEGRDLEQLVRARGPLPIEEAVGHVLEACVGVAEAHSKGIIHRDIKPANLFLARRADGSAVVKVLDFGISKVTALDRGEGEGGSLTQTETTLGSPYYMSPEQLRSSKTVDGRTDLWSIGMVLHKLLTARLAFEATSVGEHLTKLVAEPPRPLRAHRPDAPAALEAALLRCLEKDPDARFQDLAELAQALAPFAPPSVQSSLARIYALLGEPPPPAETEPAPPVARVSSPPVAEPGPAPTELVMPGETPTPPAQPAEKGETIVSMSAGTTPLPPRTKVPPALLAGLGLAAGVVIAVVVGSGARSGARFIEPAPARMAATAAPSAAMDPPALGSAPTAEPVSLTLTVEPIEAIVELDGSPTRLNPLRLARGPTRHTITVRAAGYQSETRAIDAQADASLTITLKKAQARAPAGRPAAEAPAKTTAPGSGKPFKGPLELDP